LFVRAEIVILIIVYELIKAAYHEYSTLNEYLDKRLYCFVYNFSVFTV